jgi:hypothetical protein
MDSGMDRERNLILVRRVGNDGEMSLSFEVILHCLVLRMLKELKWVFFVNMGQVVEVV